MRDEIRSGVDPAFRAEIAELIVETLTLDDVDPAEIDPYAPLFGDGLCLDSIDALELAFAIAQKYGIKLRSDDELNGKIFASLDALAAHIAAHRKT
ncbi:MAG: phosphopantetheine-binding protein [Pseudomonadota bacterium]